MTQKVKDQILAADLIMDWNGDPVWPPTQEEFRRLYLRPDAPDKQHIEIMIGFDPADVLEMLRLKYAQQN